MRKHDPKSGSQSSAWDEHNLSQLRYFRSLSLRSKMNAVEGMANLVRRLQKMKEQGAFHQLPDGSADSSAQGKHAGL